MRKVWTPEKIKEGFDIFIDAQGRLPKASEIDNLEYLPSSRYIQKRFGGLEFLRKELGYTDTHFGKGNFRSKIATESGTRSRQLELDLKLQLQTYFGKTHVHREKIFFGRRRVDFYIDTPNSNFGIDIFYAETMRTLQSSVNIKMKKYQYFIEPLYLTVANPAIKQRDLDSYIQNKKNPLPKNIELISITTLHKKLKNIMLTIIESN